MDIYGKLCGILLFLAFVSAPAVLAEEQKGSGNCGCAKCADLKPQSQCPVMDGKIDKKVFVDVEGVRIYLCCQGCAAKVKEDPKAALKKIVANGERPECLPRTDQTQKANCPLREICQGCAGGKGCCPKAAEAKDVKTLKTAELADLIKSGKPVVILDARSGKFDDGQRIPGAKSLNAQATAQDAAKLIPSKEAQVVTYCANLKCPASGMLAARLKELGYTNITEYPEGIQGWIAAGNEVRKPEQKE